MMERTHQAISEAFSAKRLLELNEKIEENKEFTIDRFVRETVFEIVERRRGPHKWETPVYKDPLLLDAREILDELLHGNIERINVAKVKVTK